MATLDGLARQLALIRKSVEQTEPENHLESPEWTQLLEIIRRVLPAHPDALEAVEQAIAGMVAPMGWRQVNDVLYMAIEPYMDARVELAETIMEVVKPRTTP